MKLFLAVAVFCAAGFAARAQTPAESLEKLADEYCAPAGGGFEESRKTIEAKGLVRGRSADGGNTVGYSLKVGDQRYIVVIMRLRSGAGIVETCRVTHVAHDSVEALFRSYSARGLPESTQSNSGNRDSHYLLREEPRGGFVAKTITLQKDDHMSVGYSRFPAGLRSEFVQTPKPGGLLQAERERNAAMVTMKCVMDGKPVELQVSAGRGRMGPFPMEDLEIDGSEIAFKFQGVVHYFDFAKRTGRRTMMGVSQSLDCF